jgi:hypothetical protein
VSTDEYCGPTLTTDTTSALVIEHADRIRRRAQYDLLKEVSDRIGGMERWIDVALAELAQHFGLPWPPRTKVSEKP